MYEARQLYFDFRFVRSIEKRFFKVYWIINFGYKKLDEHLKPRGP